MSKTADPSAISARSAARESYSGTRFDSTAARGSGPMTFSTPLYMPGGKALVSAPFAAGGEFVTVADECCCGSGSGSSYVTCGDCDPAIPEMLYITCAGFAGSFAGWNGTFAVQWVSACNWQWTGVGATLDLFRLSALPNRWFIYAVYTSGCRWQFEKDTIAPCDPVGPYSLDFCVDSGCGQPNSCEDSAGASVVVSIS